MTGTLAGADYQGNCIYHSALNVITSGQTHIPSTKHSRGQIVTPVLDSLYSWIHMYCSSYKEVRGRGASDCDSYLTGSGMEEVSCCRRTSVWVTVYDYHFYFDSTWWIVPCCDPFCAPAGCTPPYYLFPRHQLQQFALFFASRSNSNGSWSFHYFKWCVIESVKHTVSLERCH